jgi:4-amino-4-deoxy-L-arabinose transferase-like glycosyltransferase
VLLFGLAAAVATSPPPLPLTRIDRAGVATLIALCGFTFFWQLSGLPPEIHGDEAEVGLDALRLLQEPGRGLFTAGWFGLPILHAAPTALGLVFFGADLFGLRATSAVLATASVLLLFAIGRRLDGTSLGFAAAFALATQRYFIHIGRTGFHYVDTPFFSLVALWLMIRVWQDRRSSSVVWCGVVVGLAAHTYFATRLAPLLLAVTALIVAARAPRGERLRHIADLALVAAIAIAIAAPMGTYFAGSLDEFVGRLQETSIFAPGAREHLTLGYRTDSIGEIVRLQLLRALGVFHFFGDTSVQYGYGAPMLDIVGGVLFLAGLGTLMAQPGRLLSIVALLWIAAPLILGGALTIDTPFFPRLSGILPFVALVIGVGVLRVAATAGAFATGALRRRAAIATAAILLLTVFALNATSYFRHYAVHGRHSPMRQIAEQIRDGARGTKTYLLDDRQRVSLYHGTVSFIARSAAREDVRDTTAFFGDKMVDARRSQYVVMAGSEHFLAALQQRFGPLDVETHLDTQGQPAFYTATPPDLTRTGDGERDDRVDTSRARPWLALGALLAAITAAAAMRQRRARRRLADDAGAADAGPSPAAHHLIAPSTPSRPVWIAALLVIVAVAAWLRLTNLEQVPAGFYCDEAGNLYNAASILRTGRDETGATWPLYVWSFDTSYKNPVFIYASMIPVALFGPTPFAARATAAAFGIAAVAAIFFFGRAIGGTVVGLFAALFLAVVPWHLHFSRIAFELIAFPTLFLIGATGLVRFLDGRRSLPWAAAVLGLSLYTYVPAKLFVPLFLCGYAVLFRRELRQRWRQVIAAVAVLAAVAAPVVAFDLANRGRSTQYVRDMTFLTEGNGIVDAAAQLANNYSHFYSPIFLFSDGDPVPRHAVRHHGELYSVLAPLLLIGLGAVAAGRTRRPLLLLLWLVLYPLAAALIRREVPSASRAIIGAPAFCLLAAVGADWVWGRLALLSGPRLRPGVIRAVAVAALVIVGGAQVARYWRLYTEDYGLYSARHYVGFQYGHRQVVDYFLEHYDEYDRLLLTTNLSNQPEIFLRLFAGLRYPPSDGAPPFKRPPKIDRGTPHELHLYPRGERILFAVVPQDLLYLADYEVLETIRAPGGAIAFLIVDVREAKDFAHVWMVAGPYPTAETPPLPDYDPAAPPVSAPLGRQWRRYQLRRAPIHVDTLYEGEVDDACAWAINFLHSPNAQTVQAYAGFDDTGEIWVNGRRVPMVDQDNPFYTWVDSSVGTVALREGRNAIAVKTCDDTGGWTFYFRLAGFDGRRVPDVEWEYVFEEGL